MRGSRTEVTLFAVVACALAPPIAAAQPCEPFWNFHPPPHWFGQMPRMQINALAIFDDGGGPALYAGGYADTPEWPHGVSKWDGQSWTPLGAGITNGIIAMTVFDDGAGTALFIAGGFPYAGGGMLANSVARWDGQSWSALGTGLERLSAPTPWGIVFSIHGTDLGSGPVLFVGGLFTIAGGVPARGIAGWDGQEWTPLGPGLKDAPRAIVGFDDGSGPALYAGGGFDVASGSPVDYLGKWDGQMWSPVGTGVGGQVTSLAVFTNGANDVLVASGWFTSPANRIAQWDGSSWSPIGGGLPTEAWVLGIFDYGAGPDLYAGGYFDSALPSPPRPNIRRWDGATWSIPGEFTSGSPVPRAFAVYDDGLPALYVARGIELSGLHRWGCPVEPPVCYANCDVSTTEPILTIDDFTCFINEFALAQGLPHEQQIESYANCDGSTSQPVLTVDDFTCFINAFAAGCP